MHTEVFVLCDAATDQGGKLNVLGTFDTIYVLGVPVVHPSCAVAVRLRFERSEEGEHDFKVIILDMDGATVGPPIQGKLSVKSTGATATSTANLVLNFQGLQFRRIGEHRVDLVIDKQVAASLPIYVNPMPGKP